MLNVQFTKVFNRLIEQYIVTPRLVNQQTLEYNKLCDYLADGSTVTATDVSAVMKQMEKKLPFLLGLNVKAICSPEGLTFRPTISGSITQSQLKAKLEARKEAESDPEKAALIDVNRELEVSDLTINDITASIVIDLPKKWLERFHSEAEFKRISKDSGESSDDGLTDGTDGSDSGNNGSTDNGGSNSGGTNTGGGTTTGGGENGGGNDDDENGLDNG